ncbi:hypothetical protein GCM10010341_10060 [Streptomyces noursei]|nr:hypothetical protein GCM10010341_10060 [Streptomyces noursei]
MCKAVRRLAAATGVLVVAGALPLVVTAPAQATPQQCESFLAEAGYKVGPKVRTMCGFGGGPIKDYVGCYTGLMSLGVKERLAEVACSYAITT